MNENKLAHATVDADLADGESRQSDRNGEIRLLDEMELALAGGGDQTHGWP